MSVDAAADVVGRDVKERLLAGGGPSVDRLPLLRAVFDDMASGFEDAARQFADSSARFFVESVTAGRASDIFGSYDRCALTAAYDGADLDSKILLGADRNFVFALVEAMFGSDGSEPACDEKRGLTNVEIRAGQFAFGRVTKALQASFASVADIAFPMQQAENKPDLAIGRKGGFALMCRCRFAAFGRVGDLFLAMPQSVIEPMRDALSQDPSVTILTADPHWAKRMKERVTQTEVSLHAVMEKSGLTLADVARFEVGQIVELPISPTSLIKLECEGQALFWCELGQKDGAYTIRIEDFVDKDQEFIDDVLGG